MNWYSKLLKLSQQGEWWIDDSGSAHFADLSISDQGHESLVLQHIMSQYFESNSEYGFNLFYEPDRLNFIEENQDEFIQKLLDDGRIEQNEVAEMTPKAISSYATNDDFYDISGMPTEERQVVNGNTDARKYSMIKWNWKRVQGNNVETNTLTQKDLSIILNGLYDAYQDNVEQYSFNIYVMTGNLWFQDIPYTELSEISQSGNLMGLRRYLEREMA